jgi:hypothetical protein
MNKTIKISKDKELVISNNLAWAMIYKSQFGHDIVPDIMPIVSAITKLLGELSKANGTDVASVLKSLDGDSVQDALIELCALQFTDFINLTWAMAKANDDDIETPDKWVRQFDHFPIDVIAPAVFDLLLKGLVSSKNLKSLRAIPGATSQSK